MKAGALHRITANTVGCSCSPRQELPILDLGTFTAVHTILSLVAIVSGLGAVAAFFWPATHPLRTSTLLVIAMLTSVTGFFFPFEGLLPSHFFGAIAVVVLVAARYRFAPRGIWRAVYAGGMVASEYLLVFVLVTQAFDKVPALNALAPPRASRRSRSPNSSSWSCSATSACAPRAGSAPHRLTEASRAALTPGRRQV